MGGLMNEDGEYEPVTPHNCTCGSCDTPIEAGNYCMSPPSDMELANTEMLMEHCYDDCIRALEDGSFAIETPGVVAGKTDLERCDMAISPCVTYGPHFDDISDWWLECTVEWHDDGYDLAEDVRDVISRDRIAVLHGDMHVWQMSEATGQMTCGYDSFAGKVTGEAKVRWFDVEPIGWQ